MFAVERQRWLVERAREAGRVDVRAAAQELGVAVETIRRDLQDLERRDLLKRVHGGAVPVEGVAFVHPFRLRADRGLVAEKRRIAAAVVAQLADAMSVYLDAGSTTQGIAEVLQPARPLTVVTPSLPIASTLIDRPNIDVVVIGGRAHGHSHAMADAWSVQQLQGLVMDVAVMAANGVTLDHGATCPNGDLAAVKAQAMRSSRTRLLACDSSKFGVDSFARFAVIEDFTHVITDRGVAPDLVTEIESRGATVYLA